MHPSSSTTARLKDGLAKALIHNKRHGDWQPNVVAKTRQIHRVHENGDRGSVAISF